MMNSVGMFERSRSRLSATLRQLLRSSFIFLSITIGVPVESRAQDALTLDRPSDTPLELPEFDEGHASNSSPITHRIPLPPQRAEGIGDGQRFFVSGFQFRGNREISQTELAQIAAPYTQRKINFADLQALRDEITLFYVNRGFVTSGATIPDQTLLDGIVELEIIEGTLAEIEIESDGRYRGGVLRRRLLEQLDQTVHIGNLEEKIRMLQADPHIARASD